MENNKVKMTDAKPNQTKKIEEEKKERKEKEPHCILWHIS